jgi:hypothetical protein
VEQETGYAPATAERKSRVPIPVTQPVLALERRLPPAATATRASVAAVTAVA